MEKEVIGYVRSAIVDDENISRQKEEINSYCNENRLIIKKIFEDNGGASNSINREGINQLFEFLAKSKGDVNTFDSHKY